MRPLKIQRDRQGQTFEILLLTCDNPMLTRCAMLLQVQAQKEIIQEQNERNKDLEV